MSQRILLVEDDPSNARLFRIICEGAGYQVYEASNGHTALEILRTERVDLVLMDLQMPGLDGLSVTRALRATPETAGLPVVIVTAWAHPDTRAALLASGVREVLIKPFRRQVLVECISGVLQEA